MLAGDVMLHFAVGDRRVVSSIVWALVRVQGVVVEVLEQVLHRVLRRVAREDDLAQLTRERAVASEAESELSDPSNTVLTS